MRLAALSFVAVLLLAGEASSAFGDSVTYGTPTQIGGNTFEWGYVANGVTWTQAELDAKAVGGYLAIIPDAVTNTAVFALALSSPNDLWSSGDILGPWLG